MAENGRGRSEATQGSTTAMVAVVALRAKTEAAAASQGWDEGSVSPAARYLRGKAAWSAWHNDAEVGRERTPTTVESGLMPTQGGRCHRRVGPTCQRHRDEARLSAREEGRAVTARVGYGLWEQWRAGPAARAGRR